MIFIYLFTISLSICYDLFADGQKQWEAAATFAEIQSCTLHSGSCLR